jgi:hypothetical protein
MLGLERVERAIKVRQASGALECALEILGGREGNIPPHEIPILIDRASRLKALVSPSQAPDIKLARELNNSTGREAARAVIEWVKAGVVEKMQDPKISTRSVEFEELQRRAHLCWTASYILDH